MPKTPQKRTARMTPAASTRRRAAIEKRPRATTLITGGTGFLGSHLVRQLVDEGTKDIRVMATSIPDWLVGLGVETIEGSITKSDDVARAVTGITDIYHLAGRVSRERDDAREMYAIHVEGTRLLCDAARAAGARTIVLASTSGTIAVTNDDEVIPDETYTPPLDIISRWPYYASKSYQEMAALERFNGKGIRLVIMNPSLFLENGLLSFENGKLRIHYDKYHDVVGKLLQKVLDVQHQGDKAASDRFIEQYTKWDDNLHGVIAKNIRDQQRYRFRLFKYAALGE